MATIYDLLMEGNEPSAAEKAALMAQALRGQRAAGGLALLTGDKVLGNFGQALLGQAQQGEGQLAQAGAQRSTNVLRQALAMQQQQQAQARAKQQAALRLDDRAWQEEQRGLDRSSREKAAAIQAGDKATQQRLEMEGGLRKELLNNPVVKEYQLSAIGLDKVNRGAAEESAAGDLALIFGFMKTLDPTSAVKETEFANAQNAAGVPDRIRNVWNKAKSGERLTPEQRAEFIATARSQFAATKQRAEAIMGGYSGLAQGSGIDPSRVVVPGTKVDLDLGGTPSAKPAAPQGGNPQSLKDVQPLPRLQPGQKAADVMEEGRYYRVSMGGGKSRVVVKRNGKVMKLSDSGGQ